MEAKITKNYYFFRGGVNDFLFILVFFHFLIYTNLNLKFLIHNSFFSFKNS